MTVAFTQNFLAGSISDLSAGASFFLVAPLSPASSLQSGDKTANRFAKFLRGVEVRSGKFDFSCSVDFVSKLSERGDYLVARLDSSLKGIITRVDVDNLCLLRLCVNGLIIEDATELAFKYAEYAGEWCERADFTDSIANGQAMTATAEMYFRLGQKVKAAKFFKAATSSFSRVYGHEHPLSVKSRSRQQAVLSALAFEKCGLKESKSFGAGYLKGAEMPNMCPLVWDGPIF